MTSPSMISSKLANPASMGGDGQNDSLLETQMVALWVVENLQANPVGLNCPPSTRMYDPPMTGPATWLSANSWVGPVSPAAVSASEPVSSGSRVAVYSNEAFRLLKSLLFWDTSTGTWKQDPTTESCVDPQAYSSQSHKEGACAGLLQTMVVSDSKTASIPEMVPNLHVRSYAMVKFAPVMVTARPPEDSAEVGWREVIAGCM